ncbi:Protein disulfide isomerase pTAC5, chloroplastic [Dirofilaria immitis]
MLLPLNSNSSSSSSVPFTCTLPLFSIISSTLCSVLHSEISRCGGFLGSPEIIQSSVSFNESSSKSKNKSEFWQFFVSSVLVERKRKTKNMRLH